MVFNTALKQNNILDYLISNIAFKSSACKTCCVEVLTEMNIKFGGGILLTECIVVNIFMIEES